ncbi:hypothetical protein BKA67DRAFT_567028 [Truncatella angustata]|uniref:Uncharacterized protein n=1 Tax=Truncatella angustata TaxID=152316 RepID=A0A9P8UIG1_9PEZI|nr:uncharacterized protein BKA67DRAFT_567028 [Truncatella angustata]KAH6652618.1 hypothetical protein BKA67DRAFT_567028 [Truncatella angustata]
MIVLGNQHIDPNEVGNQLDVLPTTFRDIIFSYDLKTSPGYAWTLNTGLERCLEPD